MKKELFEQELDVNGGKKSQSSKKDESSFATTGQVSQEEWNELVREVHKMLNNPINAYDMIEDNKRSGYYQFVK